VGRGVFVFGFCLWGGVVFFGLGVCLGWRLLVVFGCCGFGCCWVGKVVLSGGVG